MLPISLISKNLDILFCQDLLKELSNSPLLMYRYVF